MGTFYTWRTPLSHLLCFESESCDLATQTFTLMGSRCTVVYLGSMVIRVHKMVLSEQQNNFWAIYKWGKKGKCSDPMLTPFWTSPFSVFLTFAGLHHQFPLALYPSPSHFLLSSDQHVGIFSWTVTSIWVSGSLCSQDFPLVPATQKFLKVILLSPGNIYWD